jgi:HEAT repeat protein
MNSIRSLVSSLAIIALTGSASAADPPSEDSLLAILSSDAGVREKAVACQHLANWGTAKSVPALAALLSDEKLSDYARSGLEIIDDPSAAAALRDALPELKGRLLAGAVNSLGVRKDTAAIPALSRMATDPKSGVAAEAMTALALIGTPEAVKPIHQVLTKGPADLRIPAAHAALLGAEQLKKAKDGTTAEVLLQAVAAADLPAHIKAAAK